MIIDERGVDVKKIGKFEHTSNLKWFGGGQMVCPESAKAHKTTQKLKVVPQGGRSRRVVRSPGEEFAPRVKGSFSR